MALILRSAKRVSKDGGHGYKRLSNRGLVLRDAHLRCAPQNEELGQGLHRHV
jgi:hypothetical protein